MIGAGTMTQDDVCAVESALRTQAKWAAALEYEDLKKSVIVQARRQIMDAICNIVAGLTMIDLDAVPAEPGAYTLFGTDKRFNKQWATILHGGVMCSVEMDEGNWLSMDHPACHFMAALLTEAVVMGGKLKMKELITALVAAYEITCRWQGAIITHARMHGHGKMGTLGGAIAVGKLRGCTEDELYNAMVIANTLPQASAWESSLQGDTVRNLYMGLANFIGITALDFHKIGFTSSAATCASVWTEILGVKQNYPALTDGLGKVYCIERSYYKRFSACRWVHPMAEILSSLNLTPEQITLIERIDLYTVDGACDLSRQEVLNSFQARFSTPTAAAVLLLHGNIDWTTLNDMTILQAPDVKALAKKIFVHRDPAYWCFPDEVRWDRVELTMDGETNVYRLNGCPGDWDKPFPNEVLFEKFKKLTKFSWDEKKQDAILDIIMNAPADQDLTELFSMLSK